jgi:hypothetical protein
MPNGRKLETPAPVVFNSNPGGTHMLKVGDKLPAGSCRNSSRSRAMAARSAPTALTSRSPPQGKKIAIFALPGAYTPTCSAKHVPGYVEQADALKAAGVDEIWCVSVNDAFVMGAWGRDQKTGRQGAHDGRRQRRLRQGHRPDAGPDGRGMGCAPTAIRCSSSTAWSSRSTSKPRQVRGQRRRHDAQAGAGLAGLRSRRGPA